MLKLNLNDLDYYRGFGMIALLRKVTMRDKGEFVNDDKQLIKYGNALILRVEVSNEIEKHGLKLSVPMSYDVSLIVENTDELVAKTQEFLPFVGENIFIPLRNHKEGSNFALNGGLTKLDEIDEPTQKKLVDLKLVTPALKAK